MDHGLSGPGKTVILSGKDRDPNSRLIDRISVTWRDSRVPLRLYVPMERRTGLVMRPARPAPRPSGTGGAQRSRARRAARGSRLAHRAGRSRGGRRAQAVSAFRLLCNEAAIAQKTRIVAQKTKPLRQLCNGRATQKGVCCTRLVPVSEYEVGRESWPALLRGPRLPTGNGHVNPEPRGADCIDVPVGSMSWEGRDERLERAGARCRRRPGPAGARLVE